LTPFSRGVSWMTSGNQTMALRLRCLSCGKAVQASDKLAGHTALCPDCKSPISVPIPIAQTTAALRQETPHALGDSEVTTPVRHEGRTPLRNTFLIELALIEPDPHQPRRFFDDAEVKELAASIQARGIRSPLTVRWRAETQKYRLVDGERRYRAAPRNTS
jgi:hypothetical protein